MSRAVTGLRAGRAGLLFGAAALLAPLKASAQLFPSQNCVSRSNNFLFKGGPGVVKGTVGYQSMIGAISKNAEIYSAANAIGHHLLPLLRLEGAEGAIDADLNSSFNVLRVPFCANQGGKDSPTPGSTVAKVDLSAASFVGGYRFPHLVLFYGGSAAMHTVGGDPLGRTAYAFGGIGLLPSIWAGFFKRSWVSDSVSVTFENIVGGEYQSPVGDIALGYVGSQGLYTNLNERHIKAFLGLVINNLSDVANIHYLTAGLASLDWLVGDSARKAMGNTSIFARKLQFVSAPPPGLAPEEATPANTRSTSFTTGHIEEYGINQTFDFILAGTVKPRVDLYELSVGIHTRGFIPEFTRLSTTKTKADFAQPRSGVRLTAGVVKLPDLWFYGVQGGYRFRASLEFSGFGNFTSEGDKLPSGPLHISLAINNPETLAVFPYAYNAAQLSVAAGFLW